MKKQSFPFIIILVILYFFFNKIDTKIIVLSIIITIICCSNIFKNSYNIIENLKVISNNPIEDNEIDEIDETEKKIVTNGEKDNEVQENSIEEDNDNKSEIKEAFNYEELQSMFESLDEQINNK